MKKYELSLLLAGATGFAAILTAATVHADTFGGGANAFTIDFVTIGNAGNPDDAGAGGGPGYYTPYGGVPYEFRMGVTEVSENWITNATNLGLADVAAGAWTGNQPAANLTWFEAAAFVNFLNVSTGHQAAYQLTAANTSLTLWSSAQAWQAGGENLYRHKDAYYFLPSEDEWYKAAYHKNDGVTENYWDYATGSNSRPTAVRSGTAAGTAVYNSSATVPAPADINNSGGLSAYGTRGQDGNVLEWEESAFDGINSTMGEIRVLRGGHVLSDALPLLCAYRTSLPPNEGGSAVGMRVASVPEPTSTVLILSASWLALARRRRRAAL